MSKTSEALADRECREELKACLNNNVFSLHLKIGRELESTMSAVSEFQAAGPEQRIGCLCFSDSALDALPM